MTQAAKTWTTRLLFVAGLWAVGCAPIGGGNQIVAGSAASSNVCTAPASAEELADQVIALVNQTRADFGLPPVREDFTLTGIAETYACRMIEGGFFDHVDPETGDGPGQRALEAGYIFLAVGENLAAGQQTPEAVMDDWMNSTQGHRENILSPQWTEVGVGIRTGGEYGTYWVLEFGNPP
jgi:uncharacterized protein YkwD